MNREFEQLLPRPDFEPGEELLDIVFSVTRARRIGLGSASRQYLPLWEPAPRQEQPPPNVIRTHTLPASLAMEQTHVVSEGEPAEFVKYVIRNPALEPLRAYVLKKNPGLVEVDLNDEVGKSFGAKEFLEQLEAKNAAVDDEWSDYRAFFAHFDLHTNPILWENLEAQGEDLGNWLDAGLVPDVKYAKEAIAATRDYLTGRVGKRVKSYPAKPDVGPFDARSVQAIGHVKLLSTLQKKLYQKLDLAELREAFELFANGQLRVELPGLAVTTQPSSGFYVFFAEFALLGIDNKKDTLVWKNRFPFFVRTQPVFASVYGSGVAPGSAKYESYKSENFDSHLEDKEKEDLFDPFEGLDHQELVEAMGENVHSIVGGETGT